MSGSGPRWCLFVTDMGRCGIAWSERGIVGVQFPEPSDDETRRQLIGRFEAEQEASPSPDVRRAIRAITSALAGRHSDLRGIVLDEEGLSRFDHRVYEMVRTIARGTTMTYGEVAAAIGSPSAARAVGGALGRNPFAVVVPCHRVLAAGGKTGGFSANGGTATKRRLLSIEGVQPDGSTGGSRAGVMLEFDPLLAVAHLRDSDAAMARLVDSVGPLDIEMRDAPTTFASLAHAVVYQQLTGKAAATIYERLIALFPRGQRGLTARNVLATSEAQLRAVGLSRSKVLSLKDLAQRSVDRQVPTIAETRQMDDGEVVARLTEVRGIGRWTAEMFLIFRLGRPDVLPSTDYGVRKGLAIATRRRELPEPADVDRRGERWRPYRTAASWYLWQAVRQTPLRSLRA